MRSQAREEMKNASARAEKSPWPQSTDLIKATYASY